MGWATGRMTKENAMVTVRDREVQSREVYQYMLERLAQTLDDMQVSWARWVEDVCAIREHDRGVKLDGLDSAGLEDAAHPQCLVHHLLGGVLLRPLRRVRS